MRINDAVVVGSVVGVGDVGFLSKNGARVEVVEVCRDGYVVQLLGYPYSKPFKVSLDSFNLSS